MAFTGSPTESNTYADQTDEPLQSTKGAAYKVTLESETYTHSAGAGTGEVNLLVLPAGKITVYTNESYVKTSAYAANSDVHIGYRAYVDLSAGTTTVEDDNAFADNLDAATGGNFVMSSTLGPLQFDTESGLHIFAMIDTGNIEDDDTLKIWMTYTEGWLA